jgi:hypothetical protein
MNARPNFAMRWVTAIALTAILAAASCSGGGHLGGTSGVALQLPSCLQNLMAACPTEGMSCTEVPALSPWVCYSPGPTQAQLGWSADSSGALVVPTASVFKGDGTDCYTLARQDPAQGSSGTGTYVWKAPDGSVVATATFNQSSGSMSVACSGTGESTSCNSGDQTCVTKTLSQIQVGSNCTTGGSCPPLYRTCTTFSDDCANLLYPCHPTWDQVQSDPRLCTTGWYGIEECPGYHVLTVVNVDVGSRYYYDATTGALVAVAALGLDAPGIVQVVPCGGNFTLPDESTCTTLTILSGSAPFPQCVDGGGATDGGAD